ncbi:MAG: hypothetical protein DRP87_03575 [Spirochaetes bacterium]|nr:MAG: hypothetical protein DRP87_03575 [Spirochaetota bacterium]
MREKKKFNLRAFTSIFLAFSFINLILTSIVLYVVPPGRVANWLNWRLLGLTKDQWAAMHTVVGYAFLILSVLHIILNWKVLINYIRYKVKNSVRRLPELVLSFVFVLVLSFGSIYNWFPISYITEFGENISNSWETKAILEGAGNITPEEVESVPGSTGEESKIGSGWGRKTIAEVSKELSVNIDTVISKLKERGIATTSGERMKDLSERYNVGFEDIYYIIASE